MEDTFAIAIILTDVSRYLYHFAGNSFKDKDRKDVSIKPHEYRAISDTNKTTHKRSCFTDKMNTVKAKKRLKYTDHRRSVSNNRHKKTDNHNNKCKMGHKTNRRLCQRTSRGKKVG